MGVFLFEIEPINNDVDDFVWVVAGYLPFVYLDKSVTSAQEAVAIYCQLMYDWVDNVINQNSLEACFPVPIEPTFENAQLLKLRIDILKEVFFDED
ncbi:hypothetical protein FUA26_07045 [Seonamhaeicola algicola]|uniref:Uncharacterized protein n=1 Tax=Seonamhaeicola algicola TaxID=1719036 RepID=A0A5C7AUM3_9FLAO|nr:hypothetical protein [Seonamhaeicola algicola]TXE11814.1 hypothetical protein FUA26_07045 [Seonamhaeicola algicola]